jgi:hypothetical protein
MDGRMQEDASLLFAENLHRRMFAFRIFDLQRVVLTDKEIWRRYLEVGVGG